MTFTFFAEHLHLDTTWDLIFCVEVWELSHSTHDLSQAEKKVTVVKSEQMHKIQIFLRKMTKSLKYLEKI